MKPFTSQFLPSLALLALAGSSMAGDVVETARPVPATASARRNPGGRSTRRPIGACAAGPPGRRRTARGPPPRKPAARPVPKSRPAAPARPGGRWPRPACGCARARRSHRQPTPSAPTAPPVEGLCGDAPCAPPVVVTCPAGLDPVLVGDTVVCQVPTPILTCPAGTVPTLRDTVTCEPA